MDVFIEAVGFGIAAGAVIALGAVGFTVQFGISNVLNITYGALMTLAAYLGYALLAVGLGIWAALVTAAIGIALASVLFNRLLIAPLLRRGSGFVGVVIVTVSAGIIIQYCIVAIAGPDTVSYGQQGGSTVRGAGFVFTTTQLIIIAMTVVLMAVLHLLLTRGVGTQVAAAYSSPAYQDVYAFGLLILMLLIRPRGLFSAGTASARRLAG